MDELNSESVLCLLEKMNKEERELLLRGLKVTDIIDFLSNKELKDAYMQYCQCYADALESISNIYAGKPNKSIAEKLYEKYIFLDEESRKELSVLLYNNQEFQGYLTQILLGIIKDNLPQMLTFFKLLGIDFEKYMLEALRLGKGYKRYIIE